MKKLSICFCILLISSCTSYRNANTDGYSVIRGGFTDQKISNGIYRIETRSGVSVFANEAGPINIWQRRAAALCPGGYYVYDSSAGKSHEGEAFNVITHDELNTYAGFASGYAICNNVTIPMDEIVSIINAQEQADLDKLLSEDL